MKELYKRQDIWPKFKHNLKLQYTQIIKISFDFGVINFHSYFLFEIRQCNQMEPYVAEYGGNVNYLVMPITQV